MRVSVLSALVVALSLCSRLSAVVVVNETFDGYADQAAFQAAWAPIGTVAPLSGTLSTEQFVSSSKSIKIDGTATNSQQRNRLTFADSGLLAVGNSLTYSFDFYDSNAAANPYRQYSNLQDTTAPSATNQLIAMGLNNNLVSTNDGGNYYMARILGFTPTFLPPTSGTNPATASGAFFKLNTGVRRYVRPVGTI